MSVPIESTILGLDPFGLVGFQIELNIRKPCTQRRCIPHLTVAQTVLFVLSVLLAVLFQSMSAKANSHACFSLVFNSGLGTNKALSDSNH